MEIILSGKDKDIKKFLKVQRLWIKRNSIEVVTDEPVIKPKKIKKVK